MDLTNVSREKINKVCRKYSAMDYSKSNDSEKIDNEDIIRMIRFLQKMAEIIKLESDNEELLNRFAPVMNLNNDLAFCYAIKELFPD